jgi:hypothetical protein
MFVLYIDTYIRKATQREKDDEDKRRKSELCNVFIFKVMQYLKYLHINVYETKKRRKKKTQN